MFKTTFKKLMIIALMVGGISVVNAADANAWVVRRFAPVRRIAPVRRVAARAVLPPYPVARRVARPVVRRPVVYGPRVSVGVGYGYGGYYGW